MPFDSQGRWHPKLAPRQFEVFNAKKRATLVPGPRLSGKTRAVLQRLARHLWECDRARIGFFARTVKSTKDGGSWSLFNNDILPEWFNANIGMHYTSSVMGRFGPKSDGTTRTMFFKVKNAHGGESECFLFSLDNDADAEAKLKELEFSCIYFSELDKFGDRRVLTVALPSLRMGHLRYEDQFWIADCNPSEEGESSWIYQTFFKERAMSYPEFCANQKQLDLPIIPESDFNDFYGSLDVIEILPADNPFIDPRQLQEVRVSCGADQGLYARHVEGKWIWGGGDASRHFRGLFNLHLHVAGRCEGDEADWEVLLPSLACYELVTGWDVGEALNHAAVAMEKILVDGKPSFRILDELVSVGKEITIEAFTLAFMELIEGLERTAGKQLLLNAAWSDRSSLEKFNAISGTYAHMEVAAASSDRINLQGVPKPSGSVKVRVNLLRQLLREKRFLVSAHCLWTIKMLKDLRKGKDTINFVVNDENKHIFDAISYALLMECAQELRESNKVPLGVRESLEVHIR